MLELTRRLSEGVQLGQHTMLTVIKLLPGQIHVQFEQGNSSRVLQLEQHKPVTHTVDGMRVQIELISVIRGIARIGFLAPRRLKIDRTERLQGGAL